MEEKLGFGLFLRRNLGLKIFCVALSIFLWFWVRYTEYPITGKTESQTSIYVPIIYQNEKKSLILTKAPDKVIINVKGAPELIDKVTPDQFKAFVDLASQGEGQNWVDISVRIPPGFTLIDLQPQRASILLEKFEEKKFPLKLDVRGKPKEGFKMGDPVFSPEGVEISGSQSTLKKINEVIVSIDVTGRDRDMRKLVQPEPRDKEQQFIPVRVNPEFIEIDIPIRENIRTVTMPISPNVTGTPKGFFIDYVEVEPPVATVLYSGVESNPAATLKTESINLKNVKKNYFEKEVNIIAPVGSQLVDQRRVKVKVYLLRR